MAYTEAVNKAVQKYVKEKQKQIIIKYKKEEYEEKILPAIEASGLQTATFIKRAVEEKIERDQNKK